MKIVEGEAGIQRTDAWLAYRKTKIFASEVAAIMGKSPWATAEDIFFEKLGLGKERVVTAAMQHGIDNESTALAMLNRLEERNFVPLVVESVDYPWLGASLDGFYNDMEPYREIAEIKCVSTRKGLMDALEGIVPEVYKIQIQAQLICSGADICLYTVYFEDKISVVRVEPDPAMQAEIIEATKQFWERVQNLDPPEPKYVEKTNTEWMLATLHLEEVQKTIKELQDKESILKENLVMQSEGKSSKGYGYAVIHSARAGAIDYAKICAERNIDTTQYRKPATQVVTVRKVN